MRCITAAAEQDSKLHAKDQSVNPRSQGFLQKLVVDQLMRKFLAFLYNPEVHDRVHNSLPVNPIFGHLYPVNIITYKGTGKCEVHPRTGTTAQRGLYIYIYIYIYIYVCVYFFLVALRPNAGHGLLIHEVSRSHTTTHHSR